APLPPPPPPRGTRVRRRLRRVQGPRKPAAPQGGAGVMRLRRSRNLVDGRGGDRGGGSSAPAVLRRRALHRNQGQPGRDPVGGITGRVRGRKSCSSSPHPPRQQTARRTTDASWPPARATASTSSFSGTRARTP